MPIELVVAAAVAAEVPTQEVHLLQVQHYLYCYCHLKLGSAVDSCDQYNSAMLR